LNNFTIGNSKSRVFENPEHPIRGFSNSTIINAALVSNSFRLLREVLHGKFSSILTISLILSI